VAEEHIAVIIGTKHFYHGRPRLFPSEPTQSQGGKILHTRTGVFESVHQAAERLHHSAFSENLRYLRSNFRIGIGQERQHRLICFG
jgi:hypothetical protein